MFYAIVTWVLWNFMELYGTLRLGEKFRNFMELFNVFYGTEQLWQKQHKSDFNCQTNDILHNYVMLMKVYRRFFSDVQEEKGIDRKNIKIPFPRFISMNSETDSLRGFLISY